MGASSGGEPSRRTMAGGRSRAVRCIPRRHHTTIFESTPEEIKAVFELIQKAKELLLKEYKPDGFNIVANCEEAAGQIVMHAHVHLLPRYKGQGVTRNVF